MNKKNFSLAVALVATLGLAGCEAKREQSAPSVEQVEVAPTAAPTPSVDPRKVEEVEAAWKIASASPFYGTQYRGDWEAEVRKSYRFEKPACESAEQWAKVSYVFYATKGNHVSLEATSVSADELFKVRKEVGRYYALMLLQAALDNEVIRCLSCDDEDPSICSVYKVEQATRVLAEAGLTPQNIGATPESLRALHLECAKRAIPVFLGRLKEDAARGSDRAAPYEIGRFIDEWHYTPTELGLTKEDLKRLDELTKSQENEGD